MSTRKSNEKKFKHGVATDKEGRLYSRRVDGPLGWYAVWCTYKEVDAEEKIIRFWQEIYSQKNELIEIHEKFPIDMGHKRVK